MMFVLVKYIVLVENMYFFFMIIRLDILFLFNFFFKYINCVCKLKKFLFYKKFFMFCKLFF